MDYVEPKVSKVFNAIAPVYNMFFNMQVKYFETILNRVETVIDISQYQSIIDVGCGTGALCRVLNQRGFEVTGIDSSKNMIKIAKKRLMSSDIKLHLANALERTPFPDKSFDMAISSYTVHGLNEFERRKLYTEMNRLAKHQVIFHDYNQKRAFYISIAEWLEGGNYFNFIKRAKMEMAESFKEVKVFDVDRRAAWYICTPYS
jgi:ubiquinone/menaquinone biosynthesis C-methylase UbiE